MKKYIFASLALVGLVFLPLSDIAKAWEELPVTPALFETSLAAPIGTSNTSMDLVQNLLIGGEQVTGSPVCFTIDSNQPNVEYVCGVLLGTHVSDMQRGIDPLDGQSSNPALQFSHRRGANVKITDFPTLTRLARIFRNDDPIYNTIRYDSSVATSTIAADPGNLVNVQLLQETAFDAGSIFDANTLQKGVVQIGTGAQAAAPTDTGTTGAVLVIPTSAATSTYNSATAANRAVITGLTGKIDNNFIATSTLFATSSIYMSPIGNVAKNARLITTLGTTTFTLPTGVTSFWVKVVGAGSNGGAANTANSQVGTGGSAGGCAEGPVTITGTTTVPVFVAAGNAATTTTFGTYMSAMSGLSGGTATGGILNINGQVGGSGNTWSTGSLDVAGAGMGGSSCMGFGGIPQAADSDGPAGTGYGSGGAGAYVTNASRNGGAGAQGAILITW